ncbi:MAG: peptide chain release factor N(5)-glutamine methyltransferase [Myxococcota bacterium]|nr:peptide chain release factor N(5)-glutamine methyltransferase [Myxococcota bacterium]
MSTVVEVLRKSQAWLEQKGSPSARLDAELLLADALGLERLEVYLQFDKPLTEPELATMREHVRRRGRREPVASILGEKEFYSLPFKLAPGILVPRPDTESLVEAGLELIPEDSECFVADIGAGSGCVGLTLAHHRPDMKLYAVDIEPTALSVIKENTQSMGLAGRVAILHGSLMEPIPNERPVDVVVSNPPYIPTAEIDRLPPEISEHEARSALDGGIDGLDVYRSLVPSAAARARIGIAMEVGDGQAESVASLFEEAGLSSISIRKDLAGINRVVIGKRT